MTWSGERFMTFVQSWAFCRFFNLECISCWKQQRQNAVIFSYHVYWICEFYETSIILGKACISIILTRYDWKPASAQNSPPKIHYPSSRCRDKHYYYHERKKSILCFCSLFLLHNICYYFRNQHMKKDKGKLIRGDSVLPFP